MTHKILEKSIRGVKYTVSLPERMIRSLTALFGGLLKEASDFLIPEALKASTSYRIFIGNLLRYAVENVGRVEDAYPDQERMGDEYGIKKTLGNGIEMIGIVAVNASPLWVLAFFSDALWGVSAYFKRIAEELEKEGIMEVKEKFEKRGDLLEAIQRLSDSLASNIDTPPLTKEELKENFDELKAYFREVGEKTKISLKDLKELWNEIVETAKKEKKSILEISGAITLHLMNRTKSTMRTAKITGKVTSEIIHQHVLEYYREALKEIKEEGYLKVVRKEFRPYLTSALHMFSPEEKMLTERILSMETVEYVGRLKEKREKKKRRRLEEKEKRRRQKIREKARKRREAK